MITRVWHGVTSLGNAEKYLEILLTEGTKEYQKTKGNLSVKVWRKKEELVCHFWTLSEWKDIKAIQNFAGEEYEKAKYMKQDYGILLEFEEKVVHYETFVVK